MYPLLLSLSILSLTPIWSEKEIYSTWTPRGEGYEYVLEIYTDRELTQLYTVRGPTSNFWIYTTFTESNLYFQRVRYYIVGSGEYDYEYLGQFYLNLEHGYYGEDIIDFPEEDVKENGNVMDTQLPVNVIKEEKKYTLSNSIDYREDIKTESILGTQVSNIPTICNISILRKEKSTIRKWNCNLDIQISKVKYSDWGKYISLDIGGIYPKYIYANIKIYECKKFTLLDSKTWSGCKEILVDTYEGDIKLIYFGNTYLNGISQSSSNFSFMDTTFSIRNTFLKDISKENVTLNLNMYSQVKSKDWIDIEYTIKKDITIPKLEKVQSSKPFSFPLDRYIGVTQWHGCTKYQCPHKGIDFGAKLNRVISIGDGKVVKVGYDKYGGECNQGGKYVIIKHNNGIYSTYFHLDYYKVKVGDTLKKGSLIGISGNTGKWNCQNLGYHLHFETRKNLSPTTHVNPVKYIDIDWNLIPTIGYKQYPKRLSGDNPHPNF